MNTSNFFEQGGSSMIRSQNTYYLLALVLLAFMPFLAGCDKEADAGVRYDESGYWIVPILPEGPKVLMDESHVSTTTPAVNGQIVDVVVSEAGAVEVTFIVPDYDQDVINVEFTIAKWLEDKNTWMSMLQRTRERGPQSDPMYGDGAKVVRAGNLRLENGNAVTGGEPVYQGMRFTAKLMAPPGDYGNVSGEYQAVDFSQGVRWRRASDNNPATYGDPDNTEYQDFVRSILDEINQFGAWEKGIYRVAVTERNRGQDSYIRFNAVADFRYDGKNTATILTDEERRHSAGEAIAKGSCFSCHSPDLRFPTNLVHGEQRHDPTVCANCHNSYTWDSRNAYAEVDGWPSMDMMTLTHKIHSGMEGYVADAYSYQEVRFPYWTRGRTPRPSADVPYPNSPGVADCTSCHVYSGMDNYAWKNKNPDPHSCASCHAKGGVEFWIAEPGDPDYEYIQRTYDCGYNCGSCHGEDKPLKYSADHYHEVSQRLEQLALSRSYVMEIVNVENAVSGQRPSITWRVSKDGEYQDLFSGNEHTYLLEGDKSNFDEDSIRLGIGWGYNNNWLNDGILPRANGAMGDPLHEIVHVDNTDPGTDNTYAVTLFDNPLPEQAAAGRQGFAIIEIGPKGLNLNSVMQTITLGPGNNAGSTKREEIVSASNCLGCHGSIGRHGTYGDHDISTCTSCHNAGSMSRDASAVQGTVDFMYIIHAIHGTGEKRGRFDRRRDHTVEGHYQGGYSYVRYPGTILDCQACHVNESNDYTRDGFARLGVIGDKMKDRYLEGKGVNAPVASTCYSCHQDTERPLSDWELRHHLYHSGGDMYGNHNHEYYLDNKEKCIKCHK